MSVDLYEDDAPAGRGGSHGERRDGQTRPLRKRHIPYVALFLIALVVVPVVETLSWLIHWLDEPTGHLVAWGWMITGALIAVFSIALGLHRRRATFVIWHVAVTAFLWGSASALTTLIGWSPVWGVIHFFGSLLLALSWSLYRIDAFRASATGAAADGWAQVIGLARSRPRKITHDDAHVYVEVAHGPGETGSDVQSAAKKLASSVDAIGVTVTPGKGLGSSHIALEMADAFQNWREFPGLSHPGGHFALPFRTAYYATGADQWFSFAATLGYESPLTDFVSEKDTFVGCAGTTGAGKSGFLNNAAAEALSRRGGLVVWLDKEKFFQNAGWCADMLAMGGNAENAGDINKALRLLAEYRVGVFGQVALDALDDDDAGDDGVEDIGRKWTPELYEQTGEAAVLVIVDEADTAIQAETWKWLAARGRSLGIFLCPALPRASTAEVPAVVRGSVQTWKTFAVGDQYSQGFTIPQEVEDAGADPRKFTAPGLHYLTNAPGVDKALYPLKAREYKSTTRRLRRMVKAARETFTPATFTPGAIEAMGEHYQRCRPDVVLGRIDPDQAAAEADANAAEELAARAAEALAGAHAAWSADQGGQPMPGQPHPDPQQTMPMSEVQMYVHAVAAGVVDGDERDVRNAQRILMSNGVEVPEHPRYGRPEQSAPQAPAATRRAGEEDSTESEEPMGTSATGTDVDGDRVALVDLRQNGIGDDDLAREMAAVDPHAPISTAVGPNPIQFDAVDPARPRWDHDATEKELDRVIAEFWQTGHRVFTNQEVMTAMRCEFTASTCSRRLSGLADTERIVPPGISIERTQKSGTWRIKQSRPAPRPRQN